MEKGQLEDFMVAHFTIYEQLYFHILCVFSYLHRYVSDRMGSCISRTDLTKFSYELHMSELKTDLGSNVIPIGKIKSGIYYHRALLFKVCFFFFFVFIYTNYAFIQE